MNEVSCDNQNCRFAFEDYEKKLIEILDIAEYSIEQLMALFVPNTIHDPVSFP